VLGRSRDAHLNSDSTLKLLLSRYAVSEVSGNRCAEEKISEGLMVIRGTKHPQRCGLYRENILLKDGTLHRAAKPTFRAERNRERETRLAGGLFR
jgi:hypothetical protein